ncbi:uncharacterized protein LOC110728882 [Chenopodium quinoa]|uniref:uncharacterized protein LOC110728882 n=1 Tax=Chenopodium quinoa TaxID=63459 RepID=UPI000B78B659|nr:uncharacterized protein LOC110728882 [Chenopodium quinoa]
MRRSNKKIKRTPENSPEGKSKEYSMDVEMISELEEMMVESQPIVQPHDEVCPNFLLTKEEKKRLRRPWQNTLIIKLFDKKLNYKVFIKRLRIKWSLKGDISLIDVGFDYYIVRFTNMEDHHHVLTQGPWIIGDSYLTIRKWIPNFVADDAPIKFLTAWVHIPHLSVEYFVKQFLHKIGSKFGRVISIDKNIESMSRCQFVRFSIEVDFTKSLLSKFKLNGKVWRQWRSQKFEHGGTNGQRMI